MIERIGYILFVLLIILISSDLNGFFSLFFGTTSFLSPLILAITFILLLYSLRIKIEMPSLTIYLFGLYAFWLFIGSLIVFSKSKIIPFDSIRYYLPSVLLFYVFSKLFMYYYMINKLGKIINVISLSLTFNCIAIIWVGHFGNFYENPYAVDRSSGFIASVNQAGVTASITQVFILFQYLTPLKKRSNYLLVFYFIALYASFLTFSKAAFGNAIIIAITFFITINFISYKEVIREFLWKRNKKTIRTLILLLLPVVFIFGSKFFIGLTKSQLERVREFGTLIGGTINEETTTGRSEITIYAINQIKIDNYLGRGIGTFHRIEGIGYGAHNQFLLLLGEVGLLGMIIYLWYFLIVYYKIFIIRNLPLQFLAFGLINIMLLTSMVSHTVLYVKLYILIFSLMNCLLFFNKKRIN